MKKRFSEEQIIGILKEQEGGLKTGDICRRHGISEGTFYNWKSKYGGMDVSEAQRLRSLEDENRRLKNSWPRRSWIKQCLRRLSLSQKSGKPCAVPCSGWRDDDYLWCIGTACLCRAWSIAEQSTL